MIGYYFLANLIFDKGSPIIAPDRTPPEIPILLGLLLLLLEVLLGDGLFAQGARVVAVEPVCDALRMEEVLLVAGQLYHLVRLLILFHADHAL